MPAKGGLDNRWAAIIIALVIALAAVAITAIVTFGNNPSRTTTSASTTSTSQRVTTSSTTTPPNTSTTAAPATTLPPTTTPRQTITYGSPTGAVVWQTGDAIPSAGGNAYEGYYCCNEPFPDGMIRSGSAGCSGQGGIGGFYANGMLC